VFLFPLRAVGERAGERAVERDRAIAKPGGVERQEWARSTRLWEGSGPSETGRALREMSARRRPAQLTLRDRALGIDHVRWWKDAGVDLPPGQRELLPAELERRLLDLVGLQREDDVPIGSSVSRTVVISSVRTSCRALSETSSARNTSAYGTSMLKAKPFRSGWVSFKLRAERIEHGLQRGAERAPRPHVVQLEAESSPRS